MISDAAFIPDYIYIIGVGGVGSQWLERITRFLRSDPGFIRKGTEVVMVDMDTLETKNLSRQAFYGFEVGKPKAFCLSSRYQSLIKCSYFPVAINEVTAEYIFHKEKSSIFFLTTDNMESRNFTLQWAIKNLGAQVNWLWVSAANKVEATTDIEISQAFMYGVVEGRATSAITPFELYENLGAATGPGLDSAGQGCGVTFEQGVQSDFQNTMTCLALYTIMRGFWEKGQVLTEVQVTYNPTNPEKFFDVSMTPPIDLASNTTEISKV
jgi:hypothetical protein